jgi:hypothetical protein
MEEQTCFICRKHQGVIAVPGGCIYENEYVYVGHIGSSDITVYKGYLIVDLKRHCRIRRFDRGRITNCKIDIESSWKSTKNYARCRTYL